MKKTISLMLIVIMVLLFGTTVFAAPKAMPDGGIFDAAFYAATYPDAAAVFGTGEKELYGHYVRHGKAEGRLPYSAATAAAIAAGAKVMPDGALFDPAFYFKTYPDVAAVFGNNEKLLYQHYKEHGMAEGRLPYAAAATGKSAAAPAAPAASAPAAPAAPLPGYGPGTAKLILKAGSLSACYRFLRSDGSEEFIVFLAPGQSVTKSFPAGKYMLKTAEGKTWISNTQAFGPSGHYSVSDLYTFDAGGEYQIVTSTTHGDFNASSVSGFLN